MKKMLLVIDVQKDFINKYTKKYINRIEKIINSGKYDDIAFTKFINNNNSIWYTKLNYKGCLSSIGQNIVIDTKNNKIFEKNIYSALNNELKKYIKINNIKEIYLCGFETDACVHKTALDMFEQGYNVFVLKDYCMSSKGYKIHNLYINNLKRLIGKDSII